MWHRRETRRETEKTKVGLRPWEGNLHREVRLSRQKSAEGIVRGIDPTEGPNVSFRTGSIRFDGEGETA